MINLKRRPDRLEQFKKSSGLKDDNFERFDAFDGATLTWNNEIDRLFSKNNFGSRSAHIGCALSHYHVWRRIASTTGEMHLVFEDDAVFVADGWVDLWNTAIAPDLPLDRYKYFV